MPWHNLWVIHFCFHDQVRHGVIMINARRSSGFTLIELLVVIAIIAVLIELPPSDEKRDITIRKSDANNANKNANKSAPEI